MHHTAVPLHPMRGRCAGRRRCSTCASRGLLLQLKRDTVREISETMRCDFLRILIGSPWISNPPIDLQMPMFHNRSLISEITCWRPQSGRQTGAESVAHRSACECVTRSSHSTPTGTGETRLSKQSLLEVKQLPDEKQMSANLSRLDGIDIGICASPVESPRIPPEFKEYAHGAPTKHYMFRGNKIVPLQTSSIGAEFDSMHPEGLAQSVQPGVTTQDKMQNHAGPAQNRNLYQGPPPPVLSRMRPGVADDSAQKHPPTSPLSPSLRTISQKSTLSRTQSTVSRTQSAQRKTPQQIQRELSVVRSQKHTPRTPKMPHDNRPSGSRKMGGRTKEVSSRACACMRMQRARASRHTFAHCCRPC